MKRADGEGCFNYVKNKDLWRYIVSFPEGRKTFYGKTRKECLNKSDSYKKERETNGLAVNIKTPFSAYYEHYITSFKKSGASTTCRMYDDLKTTMQKPDFELFNMPLGKITNDDINLYFESLQGLIAYSTAKRIRSVLNQVFELAVKEKIFNKNPVHNIKLKESYFKETRDRNFLSADEIKLFINYIDSKEKEPLDIMLIFIIHTGLRVGELLGLKWSDIRNDYIYITNNRVRNGHSYICKKPKSKAGIRKIPLSDKAKEILNYFSSLENKNEEFVFVQKNGKLPEREVLRYHLNKACKESGVPTVSIHELRHSFGSLLLAKGVDIKVVSTLMGHSSISITYSIYIHLTDSQMESAIIPLNNLL